VWQKGEEIRIEVFLGDREDGLLPKYLSDSSEKIIRIFINIYIIK
jgi:hypothetical protein